MISKATYEISRRWKSANRSYEMSGDETQISNWKEFKRDVAQTWLIMFVIQLAFGAYSVYQLVPQYPDHGFFFFAIVVLIGAALMAVILTLAFYVLVGIAGGFALWLHVRKNKDTENDS